MGGKISDAGRAIMPVSAAMAGLGVVTATKFAEVDKIMQLTNKTMGNTAEEAKLLDEFPADTQVTLNQYNVQAYKKHINTIEYQPTEKVVGYTHQWKVSKSGHYMGVGADYDIDDKKVMMKIIQKMNY